jgi:hypothetical protein
MAEISEFLDELTTDENLLNAYLNDPTGTMTESGLTEKQQALILGDDLQALRAELVEEAGGSKVSIIVHIIVHIPHWPWPPWPQEGAVSGEVRQHKGGKDKDKDRKGRKGGKR